MARSGYVEGKELMLYVDTSTDSATQKWNPTAGATSHGINYSAETKTRQTKDGGNGMYDEKKVSKINVQIKCDALMKHPEADKQTYADLLTAFKSGKPVRLKYGFATEEADDTYEDGLFIISAIDQTAAAGEDATFSATFDNTGEVKTVPKSASKSGSKQTETV
jgi:predicted secreted protein